MGRMEKILESDRKALDAMRHGATFQDLWGTMRL